VEVSLERVLRGLPWTTIRVSPGMTDLVQNRTASDSALTRYPFFGLLDINAVASVSYFRLR
jgi:hypothetical protein